MTEQQRQSVKNLIPDLLPMDHVSLNTKRIRFIRGQGVVLYDDIFAVEIYVPLSKEEKPVFFGVQRHHGQINGLYDYYRRPMVLSYSDPHTTQEMKEHFDEAIFQYQPLDQILKPRLNPIYLQKIGKQSKESPRIYYHDKLSGAA